MNHNEHNVHDEKLTTLFLLLSFVVFFVPVVVNFVFMKGVEL